MTVAIDAICKRAGGAVRRSLSPRAPRHEPDVTEPETGKWDEEEALDSQLKCHPRHDESEPRARADADEHQERALESDRHEGPERHGRGHPVDTRGGERIAAATLAGRRRRNDVGGLHGDYMHRRRACPHRRRARAERAAIEHLSLQKKKHEGERNSLTVRASDLRSPSPERSGSQKRPTH